MTDLLTKRSAVFADQRRLRLTLERSWDDRPKVCFIGHNPSTADETTDDMTVRRWMHFARAWGYGGFVAVNLYPIRAADVREAYRWIDWESNGPDWYTWDAIFFTNLPTVVREAKTAGLVVACWGAIARDEDFAETVLEKIMQGAAPWRDIHVFGLSAGGFPLHPMARGRSRVPDTARPVLWRRADGRPVRAAPAEAAHG